MTEMFALREGERLDFFLDEPKSGRWFAVQLRSLEPPGPARRVTQDGTTISMAALVACDKDAEGLYRWLWFAPGMKRQLAYCLEDSGCEYDRWYYAKVEDDNVDA